MLRLSRVGLFALALGGVIGCGNDLPPVSVFPVSGQIYHGGKPAEGVQVFLMPTSAPTIPQIPANPRGVTDRDGKFQLTTFVEKDGAAPGGYQVILNWPAETAPEEEQVTDRLLGWYDGVNSQLNVTIKDRANTLTPFQLPLRTQPPKPSEGVPGRN